MTPSWVIRRMELSRDGHLKIYLKIGFALIAVPPKKSFPKYKSERMQYRLHRADERGVAEHGWLHSRFSFSFAEYHNNDRMGFGALRVINDDTVEPKQGFGMHSHRDMEIITIVLKGSIEHRDSLGHHGITRAGEIQLMSAGNGIEHSEYNPSENEPLELLQIWIFPHTRSLPPRYEQRAFNSVSMSDRWVLLVSPDGREESMRIFQNASIKTAHMNLGSTLICKEVLEGEGRLIFVIEGSIKIFDNILDRRDEFQTVQTDSLVIHCVSEAHIVVFEVPMQR